MSNSIFARAQAILSARQASAEAAAAQKAENEALMVSLFEGTPEGAYLKDGVCRLQGNAIFGGPRPVMTPEGNWVCEINPESQLGSNAQLLASRRQEIANRGADQAEELLQVRKDKEESDQALAEMLELRIFAEDTKKFCDSAKAEITELESAMKVADEVYADQLAGLDELLANW